ncbi:hypothetical protein [Pseudoalteromonas luteoviolacea]|uniref:Uncharacterized protein n=2 Tax=Pseudoalteromonas luteoviolacea TaxID=43657 RepID=A0A0F6ABJ2_9GAMM|nr:hypothetical protein [Pseudoalteromonas luteoviolacea]AOT08495.1 hypothetical protein S4054249_11845 [Pseudoalteromonas luteoviolacea]AOT13411.1 hypothetical protein S40542_11820 [Pseudoalteromonas luteoviolacea]AOT18324.1 hypothetical protein S4054_11820 [Pseudoalteromonas luteoviolacea]KKE83508.1 hypothetical protein N479_14145 [Pseudoalteromonas luteoviolacea S4054]KZN75945.1 hypothetical protein N481_06240 [Pseudoalteromonas luteoviolacea S4047-1]
MMKNLLVVSVFVSAFLSAVAHGNEKENQNARYKVCHYKLTAAKTALSYPLWERKKRYTWQNCPMSWTISKSKGQKPVGVYIYLYTTYH